MLHKKLISILGCVFLVMICGCADNRAESDSQVIELEAYEDVLLTAEYIAEIYERNDMPEDAEAYRTLCSKDDVH